MMNEIAKKRIQEKLEKAMIEESLKPGQAAKLLNLIPEYISMMRKQKQWKSCPKKAWETVLSWINTGLSMEAYAKVQDESKKEKAKTDIPPIEKSTEDSNVPKVLRTNTKLVDLLKTEKLLLENRIQAIDTLLETY